MAEIVNALNTHTGRVGKVSRKTFEHPVLNRDTLVEVGPDQKPYEPTLHKSRTATEYLSEKSGRKSRLTEPAEDPALSESDDTASDLDEVDNDSFYSDPKDN